jgi:DNA-binding transcriptional ArsR family regulator
MDMDAVFRALADRTRRTLLDRLYAKNGQTLSELCADLGMSRQAVTQHLALLEEASLVVTVWHGRERLHYLNPAPLQEIHKRWLDKYERHRLEALSDLKRALESEKTKIKESPNE